MTTSNNFFFRRRAQFLRLTSVLILAGCALWAAYVFVRSGTTWTQQQKLKASDRAKDDNFGSSVAVSEGTLVVAAPYARIGANHHQGAAYVFAP